MNSVAKAYNWKNFYREPVRKTAIQVSDDVIKTYEGIYLFDEAFAAVGKKDNAYHFYTSETVVIVQIVVRSKRTGASFV